MSTALRSYWVRGLMFTLVAMVSGGQAVHADAVDDAVRRGIDYLLENQEEDGALSYERKKRGANENAMTSLALLAMAAVGHQPTDPTTEGRAMARAMDFILHEDRIAKDGYFGKSDGSRMYGHGITTLMLAEMLGMGVDDEQDRLIRERLELALDLTLRSQNKNRKSKFYGGWRYTPGSNDADMSVTCWQLMALRSAKNAGLDVPAEAIDRAIAFLKNCYHEKSHQFAYQPGQGGRYSDTAMALLSLQVCGQYEAREVIESSDWLLKYDLHAGENWFFYGTYYFAQGMYQRGDAHADHARHVVEQIMLKQQKENGSWHGRRHEENRVYATSMALLALSVRYHFLPIYQR